jgi:hypothetical protein
MAMLIPREGRWCHPHLSPLTFFNPPDFKLPLTSQSEYHSIHNLLDRHSSYIYIVIMFEVCLSQSPYRGAHLLRIPPVPP